MIIRIVLVNLQPVDNRLRGHPLELTNEVATVMVVINTAKVLKSDIQVREQSSVGREVPMERRA